MDYMNRRHKRMNSYFNKELLLKEIIEDTVKNRNNSKDMMKTLSFSFQQPIVPAAPGYIIDKKFIK